MRRRAGPLLPALGAALLLPLQAGALALDIPGNPRLVHEEVEEGGSYALPVAPWADGALPVRVQEGEVTRQAWRIVGSGLESLQIMRPLRDQLVAQGFAILLDCETAVCGGFDFRFATEVMPPPAMHVDLGAFRFLSAERSGEGDTTERVGILVSRTATQVYLQIIRVGAPAEGAVIAAPGAGALAPAVPREPAPVPDDLGFALESEGHVILSDLAFQTGSAQLGEGDFASLAALARYLADNPGHRVALVGHTDAEGTLDANITLSRRRAASVMERLATRYEVPRRQMQAEGMGWLAPLTTNLTPEGREANRRVEAVLLGGE
ncbi:MAG: OmpA family protein [Rubellimicrobium sp.]|nr:OmpA family protein [Rubellimicrobium sp.]